MNEFRSVTEEEFASLVAREECQAELNDTDPPTLIYKQASSGVHIATKVLHYDPSTPGAFFIKGF
jgi:hypothetical protein